MAGKIKDMTDSDLISAYQTARQEADVARFDRKQLNRMNYDAYHLRQDWGYKQKGQSREFLPKLAMATEQAANFITQGLIDLGDWFSVEPAPGISPNVQIVKPDEIQKILAQQLEQNDIIGFIGDSLKTGQLASLMICKVTGNYVPKSKYVVRTKWQGMSLKKTLVEKKDKAWQTKLNLVRFEDFYIDPTNRGLYTIEDIYMDYYEVKALSEGDNAIYLPEVVEQLKGQFNQAGYDKEYYKNKETGQNSTFHGRRNQIKISEYWGNVLDSEGNLIYENVVFSVANDTYIIQKPTPNPFWHQKRPYVVAPLLRVPNGVQGKALMDAPAMLNRAINELFNLGLDGAMMAVHGIKQIRGNWLEDPSQVENGIAAGETLRVNAQCPPGASVLERVDTSTVPPEFMPILNLVNQEFFSSALTNDLRMGVANQRAVKATEVVEASQSISSMFNGMAKQVEAEYLTKILEMAWQVEAQHLDLMDENNIKALLGVDRANELKSLSNAELFAQTVQGNKFRVYGVSAVLNKQKDFTKLQGLLQTVASAPVLMEAFVQEYDFPKFLTEIMKSLDIDPSKITKDAVPPKPQGMPEQLMQTPQDLPNLQSQIPQAGAQANNPNTNIPTTEFPASVATPAGNANLVPNGGGPNG